MTPIKEAAASPQDLVAYWRAHAVEIEPYASHSAGAFKRAADQLERALNHAATETLTLEQAAEESGYSTDHLGRLIREKKVPNAGRTNAPRILRRDLPRKPTAKRPASPAGDLHEGSLVRSIFSSKSRRA